MRYFEIMDELIELTKRIRELKAEKLYVEKSIIDNYFEKQNNNNNKISEITEMPPESLPEDKKKVRKSKPKVSL